MKKGLIIFTTTYPLGNKDHFIEGELPYLRRQFDQILILPVNAVGSLLASLEESPFTLKGSHKAKGEPILLHPQDGNLGQVSCLILNRRRPLSARSRDVFYAFLALFNSSDELREERGIVKKNLRKNALLYYFTGRSQQIIKAARAAVAAFATKVDSLVLYSYWFYAGAKAAVDLAQYLRQTQPEKEVRLYSRAHGYDLYEHAEGRGYLPYRGYLLQGMDAVFPCSANGVQHLNYTRPDIYLKRAAVHLARLGVPAPATTAIQISRHDRLRLKELQREKARQRETGRVFEVVTCAWIRPVKRLELLPPAFEELARLLRLSAGEDRPKIILRWTHFGDGEKDDYYKDLIALTRVAAEKVVSDGGGKILLQPRFLGACDKAFILSYYLHVKPDVFVNCSRSEGVPVSIMEAMGAGIPILATGVGGTSEVTGTKISGQAEAPFEKGASQGFFVVAAQTPTGGLWPADIKSTEMAADLAAFSQLPERKRQYFAAGARQRFDALCRADLNYKLFAAVLAGQEPLQDIPSGD